MKTENDKSQLPIEENSTTSNFNEAEFNEFFAIWVMLAQAKDSVWAAKQKDYDTYDTNNERYCVISAIQNIGGTATPSEISRFLLRKINSVSEMLNRMEKEGIIIKNKIPGRKKVTVKLTDKGLELFHRSFYSETDKRIFSVLSKKERKQLLSYLFTIRKQALLEVGIEELKGAFPQPPEYDKEQKRTKKKRA